MKNPDFQLRALGASFPEVSFSQKVPSSDSTHPVIVDPEAVTSSLTVAGLASPARVSGDALIRVALAGFADGAEDGVDGVDGADAARAFGAGAGFVIGLEGRSRFVSVGTDVDAMSVTAPICGIPAAVASSIRGEGWRAVMSAAATRTPVIPRRIARGLLTRCGKAGELRPVTLA